MENQYANYNYNKIIEYFKKSSYETQNICVDKETLSGMPRIKDTRIPVSLILASIRDEISIEEICSTYGIMPKQIEEALDYVINLIDKPYQRD